MGAKKGNKNAKKYTDKDLMEKKIKDYFKECDKKGKPYTMSGLALSLDIDRDTLVNYKKDELFSDLIKKAKQRIEQQLEESLYRLGNNSGVIFNLKNNYGWKDQSELKATTTSNIDNLTPILKMLKEDNGNDTDVRTDTTE